MSYSHILLSIQKGMIGCVNYLIISSAFNSIGKTFRTVEP